MSGYGAPSLVMAPPLNEAKAIHDLTSLLRHIDDKGELKELLENESQLNDIISDNEEVCCLLCAYIMYVFVFVSMPKDLRTPITLSENFFHMCKVIDSLYKCKPEVINLILAMDFVIIIFKGRTCLRTREKIIFK